MDIEQPVASTSAQPLGSADIVTSTAARPLAHTKGGRTAGKAHKSEKTALRRSYISPALKTPFEKRMERQKEKDAVKAVEKEMKDEQEAERERWVGVHLFSYITLRPPSSLILSVCLVLYAVHHDTS